MRLTFTMFFSLLLLWMGLTAAAGFMLPDLTVIRGAGHCEAGGRLPGGWKAWADARLAGWGF